jgi:hypothetical protein
MKGGNYMARGKAAEKLLAGLPPEEEDALMGMEGGEGAPPPPPMPEEGMMGAGPGEMEAPMPEEALSGGGLEEALLGIEAAIDGMSEDQAREIRTHLEAIREIAAQEPEAADAGMPKEPAGMDAEAPTPEMPEKGLA